MVLFDQPQGRLFDDVPGTLGMSFLEVGISKDEPDGVSAVKFGVGQEQLPALLYAVQQLFVEFVQLLLVGDVVGMESETEGIQGYGGELLLKC